MVSLYLRPSSLGGTLTVPPSKSHTLRAILFATLAKGQSVIHNYLHSPDTDAMIKACRQLGAHITAFDERLEIKGDLRPPEDVIDAGNSGQVLRFVGAILALFPGYGVVTGDHSIRHSRPVLPLLEGLTQLGAFAVSLRGDGHAPIIIKGPLKGGSALVNGEDSQPISGLLIASAFGLGKTELFVENPGEKAWIRLTLDWFDRLGIAYQNDHFERYLIYGGSVIQGFEFTVPSDLSSASYSIGAAIITNSELTLRGIDLSDIQGDKEVIFLLQRMGANIAIDSEKKTITVLKGHKLKGASIDVNEFIDALPLLAVIGCFAEGVTTLVGGKIARKKESDRISCIVSELKKMGAHIDEQEDGLTVERSDLKGALLQSHADHRMAMSLAVASLGAKGASMIEGSECVAKSYRGFFEQLKDLGAQIE